MAFETTEWSLVVAAGGDDSAAARAALSTLCEIYWYPLYAYIRRRGTGPEDARDLTQAFFAALIARRDLRDLDRTRGRFRAFLLASLQHFLANEAERRHAKKRGGGTVTLSLDLDQAEGRYRVEPASAATPEHLYERRWALTVINRVLARLRAEFEIEGRGREFDALKSCLLGEAAPGGYAALSARLGTSEGAVKVAVHRLKRRFQAGLKRDVAATVASPDDVRDEIRYLIRALDA
jgi:DNA-directed RNA polymerase specialized sigma24 family protein